VTSERRRKPFQLARGAMTGELQYTDAGLKTNEEPWFRHGPLGLGMNFSTSDFLRTRSFVLDMF
jgi:hypothetical protein